MLEMAPQNLQYITEAQIKYLALKPLNILARKLKIYQDQLRLLSKGYITNARPSLYGVLFILSLLLFYV